MLTVARPTSATRLSLIRCRLPRAGAGTGSGSPPDHGTVNLHAAPSLQQRVPGSPGTRWTSPFERAACARRSMRGTLRVGSLAGRRSESRSRVGSEDRGGALRGHAFGHRAAPCMAIGKGGITQRSGSSQQVARPAGRLLGHEAGRRPAGEGRALFQIPGPCTRLYPS